MDNKSSQKKDLLKRIEKSTKSVRLMLIIFLGLSLGLKIFWGTLFPFVVFILIIAWLLLSYPFFYFTQKAKTLEGISNIHFSWIVCELALLTAIIHFMGGVTWIVPFFYMFFAIYETFLFAKKQRLAMFGLTILFYLGLVFLEYFEIISYHRIFSIFYDLDLYHDSQYFFSTLIVGTGALIFSFAAADLFREELQNKVKKLFTAYEELKEIKENLEDKVKARTKDLEKERASLEQKVQQRTKELQEKIEELEKFKKIATGRELRMVELKKKIKQLKSKLNSSGDES